MNIVKTIKSMSAKEIIMTMVNGLKNPLIHIDMGSFGHKGDLNKDICFGCAATAFICEVAGNDNYIRNSSTDTRDLELLITDKQSISERRDQAWFVRRFEVAIDHLRAGYIALYNSEAKEQGFAEISGNGSYLPILYTGFSFDDLKPYEKLAEEQDVPGIGGITFTLKLT